MSLETEKPQADAPAREVPGRHSAAREYLESLVVTVILALYGTTFLVQAFKIPSSSMENTLLIGDHLLVDKVSYAPGWGWLLPYENVRRDHVIIFRYPRDPSTYFVKRVIGVPGDRIQLRDKRVYRNGQLLTEPHAIYKDERFSDFRDNFPNFTVGYGFPDWMEDLPNYVQNGAVVVPPGDYFAMGDNRDLSSDSRYWGFVPRQNIVGNPLVIYWSYETSSEEYQRTSFSDYIERLGDILIHFPEKTRWKRMFQVVR